MNGPLSQNLSSILRNHDQTERPFASLVTFTRLTSLMNEVSLLFHLGGETYKRNMIHGHLGSMVISHSSDRQACFRAVHCIIDGCLYYDLVDDSMTCNAVFPPEKKNPLDPVSFPDVRVTFTLFPGWIRDAFLSFFFVFVFDTSWFLLVGIFLLSRRFPPPETFVSPTCLWISHGAMQTNTFRDRATGTRSSRRWRNPGVQALNGQRLRR